MLFLQHSVSKHVIAFTGNIAIKLNQVARCEGIPQCMLRLVLETRCADNNRLTKLISDFWRYPAADSEVLHSNTTLVRLIRLQAQLLGTEVTEWPSTFNYH